MINRFHCTAATALAVLLVVAVGPAVAQRPVDHPRLRAALHELREARAAVDAARDAWPSEHRRRALRAIDDAMKSVGTILAVKDIKTFRGVDRKPEYYKRFKDHPRLRAALQDLCEARRELREAKADFRGKKEQALDDIDVAIGEVLTLIRYKKR